MIILNIPNLVTLSRIVPVILLLLFPFVAASKPVSASLLWWVLSAAVLLGTTAA